MAKQLTNQIPAISQNPSSPAQDELQSVKQDFFSDDDTGSSSGGRVDTVVQKQDVAPSVDVDKINKDWEDKFKSQEKLIKELQNAQGKATKLAEEQVKAKELENAPKDLFEAVGVDKEDFVFDMDEAINYPQSDSAKLLNGYVAMNFGPIFEKQKNDTINAVTAQLKEKEAEQKIASFRESHQLTDDDSYGQFQEFINSNEFTMEDAYHLWVHKTGRQTQQSFQQIQQQPMSYGQMLNQARPNTGQQFNQQTFPANVQNVPSMMPTGGRQNPSFAQMIGEAEW